MAATYRTNQDSCCLRKHNCLLCKQTVFISVSFIQFISVSVSKQSITNTLHSVPSKFMWWIRLATRQRQASLKTATPITSHYRASFPRALSACCLQTVWALRKLSAGSASSRKVAACFLQDGPNCNIRVRFTSVPSVEVNLTTIW